MKYSILIVNYKTKEDVLLLIKDFHNLLNSCLYEIIIVDNASGDLFSENIEKTTVIYNHENSGFGKAMNIASKKAKGNFLILVNPDCRIPSGQDLDTFLGEALKRKFGVLAPLMTYPDGAIQPNRGGASNLLTFIFQALRLGRLRRLLPAGVSSLAFIQDSIIGKYLNNFNPIVPEYEFCDWVSGAFMIIPKELYLKVGGFDESFFMYCEDEDLCLRFAALGYPSLFSSHFKVIHEVGGAQRSANKRLTFSEIKRLESNVYFLNKHVSQKSALALRLFYVILYFILSIRIKYSISYLKISYGFLKHQR